MPQPPFEQIADLVRQGQVVPFLGAGVNPRPPGAHWEGEGSSFLPSGSELSRLLARKSNFPSQEEYDLCDLAKVASYFVETSARRDLRERLHKVFAREFVPGAIHDYLASVQQPMLIVTTNYDDLMERALERAGRPYDLVIHPTDRKDVEASVLWWRHGAVEPEPVPPNKLFVDLEHTTVVYKMHGTVDRRRSDNDGRWDSYVITEDDYVDFLSRMTNQTAVPALFMRHFRRRHFLFLGYGLRDWNLRVVLRNLRALLPRVGDPQAAGGDGDEAEELRSWAIQYRPSDLEVELWNARRVKIYDFDVSAFAERLRVGAPQ
jgi:hypothetical protein